MNTNPTPGNDGLMPNCPFCGRPPHIYCQDKFAECRNRECPIAFETMTLAKWKTRAPTTPPAPVVPDVAKMLAGIESARKDCEKAIRNNLQNQSAYDEWKGVHSGLVQAAVIVKGFSGYGPVKELPAPVVTGWIACGERMPEMIERAAFSERVLVVCHYGFRHIARWHGEVERWINDHDASVANIVAWRPLPPPPGQEQGVVVSEAMVQAALRVWYSDGMSRSPTLRELLTASWGPCDNGGKYQTETIMRAAITAALAAGFPVDTPDNTTKVQPQ